MAQQHTDDLLLIGELSEATGVSTKALRYYEREGLICPGRMGRMRAYARSDVDRVNTIRAMRKMGIGIADICLSVRKSLQDDLSDVFLSTAFREFIAKHILKLEQQEREIDEQIALTRAILEQRPLGSDIAS